jgi:predicted SprT family Zn-dependent metalloprotease
MNDGESEWLQKSGTLSDKTAQEALGLTKEEIMRAIRAGQLQWREGSAHGNPYLRLLRREAEALVVQIHGAEHLHDHKARAELRRIDRELRRLKAQVAALEKERSTLLARIGK